jgi:hypothetical protein
MIRFDTQIASAQHSFSVGSLAREKQAHQIRPRNTLGGGSIVGRSERRFVTTNLYSYCHFEIAKNHGRLSGKNRTLDLNVLAGIRCEVG